MPRQTNSFQELVALIQRSLAPQGAKVTESAMVPGFDSELREIDVLIESASGPYTIKIAVEAKAESRKMDIVRFESILSKYSVTSGLKVNKVVVVHQAGFTKKVKSRAACEGVILHTLSEAMVADWALNARDIHLAVPPHIVRIEFQPAPPAPELVGLTHSEIICSCCGKKHGTAWSWAQKLIRNPDFVEDVRLAASRSNSPICVCAAWHLPTKFVVRTKDHDRHFDRIVVHVHCVQARGNLAVKAYSDGEHTVHHFAGDVAGTNVEFVVPEGPHSEQISLRLSKATVSAAAVLHEPFRPSSHLISATTYDLSAEENRLLGLINRAFDSLDVRVKPRAVVHDFSRGVDHPVSLVVQIYFNSSLRLTTAILLKEVADNALIDRWKVLAIGCGIDKVLIVSTISEPEQTQGSSYADRVTLVGWAELEGNLIKLVVPEVLLIIRSMMDLDLQLSGPVKRLSNLVILEPYLEIGGRNAAIMPFSETIARVILWEATSDTLRHLYGADIYTELPCAVRFRLPRDCYLKDRDESWAIGQVEGKAKIRVLAAVLGGATIEDGPSRCIRFVSESGTYAIGGASLPRCDSQIKLDGPANLEPKPYPAIRIPEIAFRRAFGVSNDLDLSPSGSWPHRVANMRSDMQGPWQFQLLPRWSWRMGV